MGGLLALGIDLPWLINPQHKGRAAIDVGQERVGSHRLAVQYSDQRRLFYRQG